jgi:hypothetical protein
MNSSRTRLIALCLCASFARFAFASTIEYRRYVLFEMVATADKIVAGRIQSVELHPEAQTEFATSPPGVFTLEVEERILGVVPDSIRVRCFQDWTCAGRWTRYEKGQRVVLFLEQPKPESGDPYEILGGGGEGEMPLVDRSVCVRGFSVRGYDSQENKLGSAVAEGPLVAFEEFRLAVRGFRETYTFEHGADGEPLKSIRPTAGSPAARAYAATSRMAQHLHEEASSSRVWSGEVDTSNTREFPRGIRALSAAANSLQGRARLGPGRKPDRFGFDLYTNFGRSCAFIGDVDGDGIEDIAVGAPTDSFLGHFHGALWIAFLDGEGKARRFAEIREGVNGFTPKMDEFGGLGSSVVGLGDIDGDGVPDVAVGAPAWSEPEKHRGGVWVLALTREGAVARSVELGGDPKLQAAGVHGDAGIGSALANLGDLDGDGFPEIAIAQAPGFETGLRDGRSVFIVSLGPRGAVRWARALNDKRDGFVKDYSWLGNALAGVGDVDGDGVPDLAISDDYDSDGGTLRGAVWIVFLNRDGSMKGRQKISSWQGKFNGVLHDHSSFGGALCAPGDVDGDQVPDLLVASGDGVWTLFLARDGTVRSTVLNARPKDDDASIRIGASIAASRLRSAKAPNGLAMGGSIGKSPATMDGTVWFPRLDAGGFLH